jgi:hypothetical protein
VSRGPGQLERLVHQIVTASDEPLRLLEIRGELWGWRPDRRGLIRHGQPGRWAPTRRDDRALRRALARLVRNGAITVVGSPDGRLGAKRYGRR